MHLGRCQAWQVMLVLQSGTPASWSLPAPLAADCWQDGHLAPDPLLEFCILFPLKSILFLSPHRVFLSILLRETSILFSALLPFGIDAVFNAQRVTKQRQNLFKTFLLEAYKQGWCQAIISLCSSFFWQNLYQVPCIYVCRDVLIFAIRIGFLLNMILI